MGSIVLDAAEIGEGAFIGAGSLVPQGKVIPRTCWHSDAQLKSFAKSTKKIARIWNESYANMPKKDNTIKRQNE